MPIGRISFRGKYCLLFQNIKSFLDVGPTKSRPISFEKEFERLTNCPTERCCTTYSVDKDWGPDRPTSWWVSPAFFDD